MDSEINISLPRYQKIALDLARQIAKGKFAEGERISSRTLVASHYNVSPETARRAISVLADLEIVKADKGSGVTVLSQRKAQEFTQRYAQAHTMSQLKTEILDLVKRQQKEARQLEEKLVRFLERGSRFHADNPLQPEEILLKSSARCLGQTISEINFWQETGATIVAILRGDELFVSPGPYARLDEGNVLFFVGDSEVYERVRLFLYQN